MTERDRQTLDALENAGRLYERYLRVSRVTEVLQRAETTTESHPDTFEPPPLGLVFTPSPR